MIYVIILHKKLTRYEFLLFSGVQEASTDPIMVGWVT